MNRPYDATSFCFAATFTMAQLQIQLLALVGDGGARGNGFGDKSVGSHDAIVANNGSTTQNRRIGINGHIVLNGRMPLGSPQALAASGGKAAQGNALIDPHVAADDGCLSDDDAGAVVDEEMVANGGTGVDIDARQAMGIFRHNSGNHRHL